MNTSLALQSISVKQKAGQDRKIGHTHPAFIIAEAGVNHNGSLEQALKLIDVAVNSGADAIKFQTFNADRLVTQSAKKAEYQIKNSGGDETQYEMLKKLELTYNDFLALFNACQEKGIVFISTPFDEESVDMLDEIGVSLYKIPSGEVTNLPYIRHVAQKQKPMVISTGMSTLGEVESLVEIVDSAANPNFVLLHCVSNYPAPPEAVNLRAMATMKQAFQRPIGYSDHTLGIDVSLAAVAMGACVIEKHFTLDRSLSGPDHLASLEPGELKKMVDGIRVIESAFGDGRKVPVASEMETRKAARKSLVSSQKILEGTLITDEMVMVRRPGTGFPPAMRPLIVGRKAARLIELGELFTTKMLV